ncbi:MAG: hypothetical protein HOE19_00980 [Candidatus Komeilibacteria bacterium]|jgi:hypothetical protein|nr:hypothetical protein [Candidatus Komeilibacteria bacterium]MBT4447121.1 hypothetical protein [Candidatus Komeilibacteria bacterium]
MIFKRSKHKKDPNTGLEFEESTEIWVADFGHHSVGVEEELRRQVAKLKPKVQASFSWTIVSIVLLVFIVITELFLREIGLKMYWSEQVIFWATWAWRLILMIVWLLLARLKWLLATDRMFITTITSFVSAVIILGVIKIIYVKSAWAWLNFLVEPIWVVLMISFLGILLIKFTKNKNQ